ncbi:transposase, partial [Rhizobium laguerreae]|nr:transposase [Rhizobium laguerreae]
DIKAHEPPSCGCSVVVLYNEVRPHGAIGNKVPISLLNGSSAPSPS